MEALARNFLLYVFWAVHLGLVLLAWLFYTRSGRGRPPAGDSARRWLTAPKFYYLLLLPPMFFMAYAVKLSMLDIAGETLVVHGYKAKGPTVLVGSDPQAQLRLTHKVAGKEMFAPRLCVLDASEPGFLKVTMLNLDRPNPTEQPPSRQQLQWRANCVAWGGEKEPHWVGEMPLSPLRKSTLTLDDHGQRVVTYEMTNELGGGFWLPSFTYYLGGQENTEHWRFGRPFLWGLFFMEPKAGNRRHLRPRLVGLEEQVGEAFLVRRTADQAQAVSLLGAHTPEEQKHVAKSGYDAIFPGGADILVNGQRQPQHVTIPLPRDDKSKLTLTFAYSTLENAGGGYTFQVIYNSSSHQMEFRYPPGKLPHYGIQDNKIIFLGSQESPHAGMTEIIDPNFPEEGLILNRDEKGGLRLRGEHPGHLYLGSAMVSFQESLKDNYNSLILIMLLFAFTAAFFPPRLVREFPLLALANSLVLFLCSLRVVMAYRAWQGPPYAQEVLWDSLTWMYMVQLLIVLLSAGASAGSLGKLWGVFLSSERRSNAPTGRQLWDQVGSFLILPWGLFLDLMLPPEKAGQLRVLLLGGLVFTLILAFLEANLYKARPNKLLQFLKNSWVSFTRMKNMNQWTWVHKGALAALILAIMFVAPLFGNKERIDIGSFRIQPAIFMQIVLLFALCLAGCAQLRMQAVSRSGQFRWAWVLFLLQSLVLTLATAKVSDDMGFFVINMVPFLFLVALFGLQLHQRALQKAIPVLVALVLVVGLYYVLKPSDITNSTSRQRMEFFMRSDEVRQQNFLFYQASMVPLWMAAQGESIWGTGYFRGSIDLTLRETSLSDYLPSMWLMGEMGLPSVMLVALTIITLAGLLVRSLWGQGVRPGRGFSAPPGAEGDDYGVYFVLGVSLMLVWTTLYMLLANFRYMPFTGKDLPFLALNSKNNPLLYGVLFALCLRFLSAKR